MQAYMSTVVTFNYSACTFIKLNVNSLKWRSKGSRYY